MSARARSESNIARNLQRLYETVTFYHSRQVLSYEPAAIFRFEQLRQAKLRIGSQDLRIAAIALCKNATVVTRNLRDFQQVPGLQVIDWSIA
ncbi:MAG: type II toxin-antitoxin system VapC family toxin [Caldilineaceae bacterium]